MASTDPTMNIKLFNIDHLLDGHKLKLGSNTKSTDVRLLRQSDDLSAPMTQKAKPGESMFDYATRLRTMNIKLFKIDHLLDGHRLKLGTKSANISLLRQSDDFSALMTQKRHKPGESMVDYATRLRRFADKCDFRDWSVDKMIKCMVFSSMNDEELRLSLMGMDLRLDEVLDKVIVKEDERVTSIDLPREEGSNFGEELVEDDFTEEDDDTEPMRINTEEEVLDKVIVKEDDRVTSIDLPREEGSDSCEEFVEDDFTPEDDDTEPMRTNTEEEVLDKVIVKEDAATKSRSKEASADHTKNRSTLPVLCTLLGHASMRTDTREMVQEPQAKQECKKKQPDSSRKKTHDQDEKDLNHESRKHSMQVPINKCSYCGQEFKDDASLRTHMVGHTGQNYSSCATCVKGFTQTTDLVNHLATHVAGDWHRLKETSGSHTKKRRTLPVLFQLLTLPVSSQFLGHTSGNIGHREMVQPHKCSDCGKTFKKSSRLKRHMEIHPDGRSHKCPTCHKEFRTEAKLKKHMMTHPGEKAYKCSDCGKTCTDSSNLKKHMMIHSDGGPHKCPTCDRQFRKEVKLKKHMMTHTGEKSFQCSVCGKGFAMSGTLKRHMMIHTDERPHKCVICDKAFREKGKLKIHIRTHTGEKPHACSTCGKQFNEKSTLNSHMKLHSGNTHTGEKPHQCSDCGKVFKLVGTLNRHIMTHTDERPHECPACDKCFREKGKLKIHMMTHTGEKPHMCSICGKQFTVAAHLNIHMLTHTGETPHECDVCSRRFARKLTLDLHMRTHTGEKPYKCSQCEKQFAQHGALKAHMRTHTGEKPYTCPICCLQFTQQCSVKRHMLTHTDDKW